MRKIKSFVNYFLKHMENSNVYIYDISLAFIWTLYFIVIFYFIVLDCFILQPSVINRISV